MSKGIILKDGEIQSEELMGYGSYEAKIKLLNSPSSITGFFLYREPDFHHEIDIEIYNKSESLVLLTSYNTYRINYYPSKVEFYINNVLIKSWTDGFIYKSMKLMINTWYST